MLTLHLFGLRISFTKAPKKAAPTLSPATTAPAPVLPLSSGASQPEAKSEGFQQFIDSLK